MSPRLALVAALALLAGCARPVGPLAAAALPPPPMAAARLRAEATTDQRPDDERRRRPGAAARLDEALRASLGSRLADDAAVTLRATLLALGDEGSTVQVEVALAAGPVDLLRARRSAPVEAGPGGLQGAVDRVLRGLAADIDRALALHHPALAGKATQPEPAIFVVERVALTRDMLELLYIESGSGRVLRHEAAPLADDAHARPGEWLLSRRTVEGLTLSAGAYEALVEALSGHYDLRQGSDAYRRHFFGRKIELRSGP